MSNFPQECDLCHKSLSRCRWDDDLLLCVECGAKVKEEMHEAFDRDFWENKGGCSFEYETYVDAFERLKHDCPQCGRDH